MGTSHIAAPDEFGFVPAETDRPKTLTSQQIRDYNAHGFVAPITIMDAAEVSDTRAYFDRLLSDYLSRGQNQYSISAAHLRHARVWDLLSDKRMVAIAQDILGDAVIGWGAHFFCKLPGDGKTVAFHQDAAYWPLRPCKALTIWLAIDPVDRDNGCMKFVPGSHLIGHLTTELAEEDDASVLPQKVPRIERYGTPAFVELKEGEASVHSSLLLHGSEKNVSTRRRCGLALRYTAGDVVANNDFYSRGIVLSGTPSAPWQNVPRPSDD